MKAIRPNWREVGDGRAVRFTPGVPFAVDVRDAKGNITTRVLVTPVQWAYTQHKGNLQ